MKWTLSLLALFAAVATPAAAQSGSGTAAANPYNGQACSYPDYTVLPEEVCDDEQCGSMVSKFTRGDIVKAKKDDDYPAYMKDAANDMIVIIAIGFIFGILFSIWSVCICCHCGPCKEPFAFPEKARKIGAVVTVGGIGAIGIIVCIMALAKNTETNDAITSLPPITNDWKVAMQDLIDNTNSAIGQVAPMKAKMVSITAGFGTTTSDINGFNAALISIDNTFNSEMLRDFQKMYDDTAAEIDDYNKKIVDNNDIRDLIFYIALLVMLVCVALQICFTVSDNFAPEKFQPRRKCRCCVSILSTIILNFMFLVFILAGIMYLTATVVADVCIKPDSMVMEFVVGSEANKASPEFWDDKMPYYLQCNAYSAIDQQACDPQRQSYTEVEAQFGNMESTLANMQSSAPPGNTALASDLNDLSDLLAGMKGFVSKITGFGTCSIINPLYQRMMKHICTDMENPIGATAQLVLVIAIVMAAQFFFQRIFREHCDGDSDEPKGKKGSEAGFGFDDK